MATKIWTGAAGDNDLDNPANWRKPTSCEIIGCEGTEEARVNPVGVLTMTCATRYCDRPATHYVQEFVELMRHSGPPVRLPGLKVPYCREHVPEGGKPIPEEWLQPEADEPVTVEARP